mgnify:CR=1 FL=1
MKTPKKRPAKNSNSLHSKNGTAGSPTGADGPQLEWIEIALILQDETTQVRAAMDEETVERYFEALAMGAEFPPLIVYRDGKGRLWLADGHHRLAAYKKRGLTQVACEVRDGTKKDAWMFAVGANAHHGLPFRNADKTKVVLALLQDEDWRSKNNREFAAALNGAVSYEFVRKVRQRLDQAAASGDNGCQDSTGAAARESTPAGARPATPAEPEATTYPEVALVWSAGNLAAAPLDEPTLSRTSSHLVDELLDHRLGVLSSLIQGQYATIAVRSGPTVTIHHCAILCSATIGSGERVLPPDASSEGEGSPPSLH